MPAREQPPTPPPPAELEDLADLIARLRRALRRGARVYLPFETLSVAQVEVMQSLADAPGLRAGELSERLLLAPTTVSTLIGQLLAQKLVERRADLRDRRAWRLHLTRLGARQLGRWQSSNKSVLEEALAGLAAVDHRAIARALPALDRLVGQLDRGGSVDAVVVQRR